ncbi:response regulator [Deltaproteobacteria bacterium TL4]
MEKNKILIIDDEEILWKALKEALKHENYALFFAKDGAKGLSVLKEISPVIVITDLRMPVMDGVDLLKKLQATPEDPYSIIVLTGHGSDKDVEACYNLGIYTFLRKPFNVYEVRGVIKQSIKLKQTQRQLKQAYEKLEKVDAMKDALMENLAQSIQTPISEILEDINALQDDLLPSEKYEQYIHRAIENTKRLSRFVDITLGLHLPKQYESAIRKATDLLGTMENHPGIAELKTALEYTLNHQEHELAAHFLDQEEAKLEEEIFEEAGFKSNKD